MNTKTLFVGLIPFAIAASATLASANVNQPQEIINRPRTTPGGQITVGGDIGFNLNPDAFSSVGMNLLGLYGVNDKLEVGASYNFALKEFEIKGDLGVGLAYSLLADDKLTVAATVSTGFQVVDPSGIDPIALGAEVQFKVNDKIAVYSPGGQIVIGLVDETGKGKSINVPVGVGIQVNPQIFAHVDTNIATIGLDPSGSAFIFADFIPLQVGAFFSPSNTMDFGANIVWFDLKEFSDTIGATVDVRLHM
jgi:hypothetical protein